MPKPTASEAKIREALERLAPEIIVAEIDNHGSQQDVEFFLGLLARSNHTFFKYPNAKREKLRDDFFTRLVEYFKRRFSVALVQELEVIETVVRRTEVGYRNLLKILNQLPVRSRSPTIQSAATLNLAAQRFDYIERRMETSLRKARGLSLSDPITAKTTDGTEFHVDNARAGFLHNLAATLGMFAYENKWLTADGAIILPAIATCSDIEIEEAAASEILATSWNRWERIEQRRRYWGGDFIELKEGKKSPNLPEGGLAYFEYNPTDADKFDWIANERFKERNLQNIAELRFETFVNEKVVGIDGPARLLPDQFISLKEVSAAHLLSLILGVDVRADRNKYAGLTIVEWLRAYSVLSEIAAQKMADGKTPLERHFIRLDIPELEGTLTQLGLEGESAKVFIRQASFAQRSMDMFDCPLLKLADESIFLIAPASVYTDVAMATYSNLTSLGEKFDKKGKRFERLVRRYFEEKGFRPYSIDATRNGKSYEIDVIVPWDDYLFVFECKNMSLSDHHPIRSYYFRQERDGFIEQVQRQIKALTDYPDLSIAASGIDPTAKKIVPCILYELPYSEPGPTDGVYIADWSSVSRFFDGRYLRAKLPYDLPNANKLLHRIALYSFWSGEAPTPNDFLKQLANPIQVRIMDRRIQEIESVFVVDENGFGLTKERRLGAASLPLLSKVLGFDLREVRRVEKDVGRKVKTFNKKFKMKQVVEQTRVFREKLKRQ